MASTLYSGFKTQGRSQPKEEWQALAKKWQRFESDFKRKVQFFGTGFDAAFAVTVVGHITAAYIDKSDESLEPRRQETCAGPSAPPLLLAFLCEKRCGLDAGWFTCPVLVFYRK